MLPPFIEFLGAMVGETVGRFVIRVRVENAASLLVQHPAQSVTPIALESRFSSPTVFARALKQHFDMSATAWRKEERIAFNRGKKRKPMSSGPPSDR